MHVRGPGPQPPQPEAVTSYRLSGRADAGGRYRVQRRLTRYRAVQSGCPGVDATARTTPARPWWWTRLLAHRPSSVAVRRPTAPTPDDAVSMETCHSHSDPAPTPRPRSRAVSLVSATVTIIRTEPGPSQGSSTRCRVVPRSPLRPQARLPTRRRPARSSAAYAGVMGSPDGPLAGLVVLALVTLTGGASVGAVLYAAEIGHGLRHVRARFSSPTPPPGGPPIERLGSDARRLRRELLTLAPGTPLARRTGLRLAYDDVLVEACAALDVTDTLTVLPPGTERDAERLCVEQRLDEAGLRLLA